MLGANGTVAGPLNPEGMVKIRGELWRAETEEGSLETGEEVVVVREKGLTLTVRKKP